MNKVVSFGWIMNHLLHETAAIIKLSVSNKVDANEQNLCSASHGYRLPVQFWSIKMFFLLFMDTQR